MVQLLSLHIVDGPEERSERQLQSKVIQEDLQAVQNGVNSTVGQRKGQQDVDTVGVYRDVGFSRQTVQRERVRLGLSKPCTWTVPQRGEETVHLFHYQGGEKLWFGWRRG